MVAVRFGVDFTDFADDHPGGGSPFGTSVVWTERTLLIRTGPC